MKDRYVFPAIFSIDADGISVEFPDLPGCLTCGNTEEEALYMAQEALSLHLWGMEDDGTPIPEPSKLVSLAVGQNQVATLIEAWMPPFRDRMANKAVKKILTISKWLNDLAEAKQVNFSHVLQNALKDYLGVHRLD